MTQQVLIDGVMEAARSIFSQPELQYSPGLRFHDILGFDSVQAVQFILTLESKLGITLHEDEVDRMHTMADLMEILHSKDLQVFEAAAASVTKSEAGS